MAHEADGAPDALHEIDGADRDVDEEEAAHPEEGDSLGALHRVGDHHEGRAVRGLLRLVELAQAALALPRRRERVVPDAEDRADLVARPLALRDAPPAHRLQPRQLALSLVALVDVARRVAADARGAELLEQQPEPELPTRCGGG